MGAEYQLHIFLEEPSRALFEWAMAELDILTQAEVVRRAAQARHLLNYPVLEKTPQTLAEELGLELDGKGRQSFHVRLPPGVMHALDERKVAADETFNFQIVASLSTFAEILRDTQAIRAGFPFRPKLQIGATLGG